MGALNLEEALPTMMVGNASSKFRYEPTLQSVPMRGLSEGCHG